MTKTSEIFMVRPVQFGFNSQTAGSNAFQTRADAALAATIQQEALGEFDGMVSTLRENGIQVHVFEDNLNLNTPDSIFPNNWISFHDEAVVLYPMLAENRRSERRTDIIEKFRKVNRMLIDFSAEEANKKFLEGTGSIVFDYRNRIAYANTSARTDRDLLEKLCSQLNYTAVIFRAVDQNGLDIYHTNVLMCVGSQFAVICAESIPDEAERKKVLANLSDNGHEIIEISYRQLNSFAGNMYQLYNTEGKSCIVMSEQAFRSLETEQLRSLERHGKIIAVPLYTIEKYGGGSARCMMADLR